MTDTALDDGPSRADLIVALGRLAQRVTRAETEAARLREALRDILREEQMDALDAEAMRVASQPRDDEP